MAYLTHPPLTKKKTSISVEVFWNKLINRLMLEAKEKPVDTVVCLILLGLSIGLLAPRIVPRVQSNPQQNISLTQEKKPEPNLITTLPNGEVVVTQAGD